MPRVDLSGAGVDEIVLNKEFVPGFDETNREVTSEIEVTVQSKEPLEGTVDGVVESGCVDAVVTSRPKEKLVIV